MKDCKTCGGRGAFITLEDQFDEDSAWVGQPCPCLTDRLSLLESQAVEREKTNQMLTTELVKTNQMLTTELVKREDRLAKLEQLHEAVKAYHEYVDRYVFQNEGDSVTLGELKMELRLALAALEDT